MSKKMILAALNERLPHGITGFAGFTPMPADMVIETLEKATLWQGPRDLLEHMTEFRQVIPYVVVQVGDKVVSYTRTPSGEEAGLHGKVSVGVGGHIDGRDVWCSTVNGKTNILIQDTLRCCVLREVHEELGLQLDTDHGINIMGFVVAKGSLVDDVHIGVVCGVRLTPEEFRTVNPEEADGVGQLQLLAPEDLNPFETRLEAWTHALKPHLAFILGRPD